MFIQGCAKKLEPGCGKSASIVYPDAAATRDLHIPGRTIVISLRTSLYTPTLIWPLTSLISQIRLLTHLNEWDQISYTSQSARSATRSRHLWLGSLRSQIKCLLRSRSSPTQQSKHILLGSLSLATDTAHFARAESHTKAGVICPALPLLASGAT